MYEEFAGAPEFSVGEENYHGAAICLCAGARSDERVYSVRDVVAAAGESRAVYFRVFDLRVFVVFPPAKADEYFARCGGGREKIDEVGKKE